MHRNETPDRHRRSASPASAGDVIVTCESSSEPQTESAKNSAVGGVLCSSCSHPINSDSAANGQCPFCLMWLARGGLEQCPDDSMSTEHCSGPASGLAVSGFDKPAAQQPDQDLEWLQDSLRQYEDFTFVGRGGVARVYRARERGGGRDVAIKLLVNPTAESGAVSDRFRFEAEILRKLRHPAIVTAFDFGESDGRLYLVMEYLSGITLRRLIAANQLSPKQSIVIAHEICGALQYAHSQDIVHRDIKPDNIIVAEHGNEFGSRVVSRTDSRNSLVKLTDFGLARQCEAASDAARFTQSGHILGTPYYMAPEQRYNAQQVDHRVDIYAVGVLLYEMLTGTLPVVMSDPPSQLTEVDEGIDEIVFQCLATDPEYRIQTVEELSNQLESVLVSSPVSERDRNGHRPLSRTAATALTILLTANCLPL